MDDFYFAGSQQFHNTVIDHLRAQFQLSKESLNQMLYTGIEYSQAHDEKIVIHQPEYTAKMEPVRLPNMSKNRALDALEVRQFKSLVGQLQWTAKQTRPDIAFAACELSTKVKDATTTDVRCANKQVQKLQTESGAVCIPNIGDVRQSALYVYSDASFANLAGCGSQGGYVIFLKGENGKASPLVWTSNELKHVVKSPKAAETLSMQLAVEYAFLLKSLLIEVYKIDNTHIPVISIIDNSSLHQSLYSTNVIDDKRLYVDICSMRDMLSRNEISEVKLTSSQDQLADCLPKVQLQQNF